MSITLSVVIFAQLSVSLMTGRIRMLTRQLIGGQLVPLLKGSGS